MMDGQIPGISFNQIDFVWNHSQFFNTAVGQVVANIEDVLRDAGINSGYLNGYTSAGWVIQNLMLDNRWSYELVSTFFDLGRTGDVRSIQMYLEVTSNPMHRFPGGVFETYAVGDVVFDAGGDSEDPGGFSGINPPDPEAVEFEEGGLNEWYEQPNHDPDANVQCAVNQCVPTGYANTLQYVENTFDVSVPHDLVPGIGFHETGIVVPPNSLSGYFDVLMRRNLVSFWEGNGTPPDRAIRGGLQYCYEENTDVTVRHQGIEGDVDVTWDGKKTSYHQGPTVVFSNLMESVKKGYGITLRFWRFENGIHYSGHQVCVVGAGYVLGQAKIHYCHDSKQSDEFDGLVVHETYLGINSSDGNLTLLNSGSPPDGPPEVVRIVTFDADNLAPYEPSRPHQGFGIIKLEKDTDYEFTTSTTDPEGHDLYYVFDWDDGTFTEVGPFTSGATASAIHNWSDFGSVVKIKVRARDIFYEYSPWSDTTTRVIPGFEFIAAILALVCVFILLRRKRR
ncbi:MAG: hypothetical protein KKG04_02590 [Candidatus Thermoplasmatota archaeon]|nr:hypothetical protein [Candidatus Thermoplasmatota archaeon]